MLNKIIQFSIKNKLIIGLMVLALIVWGIYSVKQLPIDAVPDITDNQVQIITSSPSNGAEDIERFVTFPVEQTMATIGNCFTEYIPQTISANTISPIISLFFIEN